MIYRREDTKVGVSVELTPKGRHPLLLIHKNEEAQVVGFFKNEKNAVLFLGVLEHILGVERNNEGWTESTNREDFSKDE